MAAMSPSSDDPTAPEANSTGPVAMGFNDHRHCLDGWHALETDARNGTRYRWTAARATLAMSAPGGRVRSVRVLAAGLAALTGRPGGISAWWTPRPAAAAAGWSPERGDSRSVPLGHLPDAVPGDGWFLVDFPWPTGLAPGPGVLTLASGRMATDGTCGFASDTVILDRLLRNGDHRRVGAMVGAVAFIAR